jgi:hypothetical protein
VSLRIDGDRLPLRLTASKFGAVEEMKEGRGDIWITAQDRNYEQSFYALDYGQARPRSAPQPLTSVRGARAWLGLATLLLFVLALLWRRRARGSSVMLRAQPGAADLGAPSP